jgi:hypothetical protein
MHIEAACTFRLYCRHLAEVPQQTPEIPLALIGSSRARHSWGANGFWIARVFPITTFELMPAGLAGGLLYGY